jgi:hypothetical protein
VSNTLGSPNYQGEALLLNITLGEILLNWNSDFLAALIHFLSGSPALAVYETSA